MSETLNTILEQTNARIAEIDAAIAQHEETLKSIASLREERAKLLKVVADLSPPKPRAKRGAALDLVRDTLAELGDTATRAQVLEAAETKAAIAKVTMTKDALNRAYVALVKPALESVPH